MAKKDKKKFQETTIQNYYDLKIDKVDELVAALKDDGTKFDNEVSMDIADCTGAETPDTVTKSGKRKQFDPYKTDFLSKIPVWVKALFVKFWFAGVVCYFILGSNTQLQDFDAVVIGGLVLGLVVDILVNPLFRYMETDRKEYNAYMMFPFPFKAFWTFFANMIYYLIVVFCINLGYFGINQLINFTKSTQEVYYVAVEPLLFGVLAVAADMVFIGIKDLIVFLVKKARKPKEATADV